MKCPHCGYDSNDDDQRMPNRERSAGRTASADEFGVSSMTPDGVSGKICPNCNKNINI